MIGRIALRSLRHRPWRSAVLLVGYGLGVGVMIVLLAIGEALLIQARDEKLVGGGSVTVLPEGLDVEVMKTGGIGGMFFSIDRARFVYRQLLAAPRQADVISVAAPQIEGKLLYLRTDGAEYAVRATGEIPSRTRAVGGAPELVAGAWDDDDGDRRWISPTDEELYAEMDRFHLPPDDLAHPESWGEWHYFNVLGDGGSRWYYLSYIIGGEIPNGEWGGQVLLAAREAGGETRRYSLRVPGEQVRFSTERPDLDIGPATVRLTRDARYEVRAELPAERGGPPARVRLEVTPEPFAYFPGSTLVAGAFASGYAVPALRGSASGSICVGTRCERFDGAQAYHDHNWGVWQGVTWEWGAARAGAYTLLYGRVNVPDTVSTRPPLFLYVVDSLGFRAVMRPDTIRYEDARTILVDGARIAVPARAVMADIRGADTLVIELEIEDATGTDTRLPLIERGESAAARRLDRPYFIQMKGTARIRGRLGGAPVAGAGTGFFETYR
jgi:hypothetical protein